MFFKKKLKQLYKQKIKRLKNRFRAKLTEERNKFISLLSHDIKTPLLAQIQSLELILKNTFGPLNEEQKEIISEILSSNYFLNEIVTNSLFLTKYENEKPKLHLENVDIIKQIRDCCEMVRGFACDKNQNIVIKTNRTKNISVLADRTLVQKIIYNLLTNSVVSGFENSKIEISVKEHKDSVSVFTKNKSIYMTKEKISNLLEEKKGVRDFNQLGTSLNLNIAKKLIEAHNWDIVASSNKNNSSTFGFVAFKN